MAGGPILVQTQIGESIFGIMEGQLGLKLEPRKDPTEVLVIAHVEKVPLEN
jgi:uncharacterized protein (TIGR03435 family)